MRFKIYHRALALPGREAAISRTFDRDAEAARRAVLRFSRLLRVNADNADAWHALGAALVELGDRAGALVAFRNALRLDDSRKHSQLALGNLLFDSGQLDQALRCFAVVENGR
jgi:cytochrome c-type biogenesis protein CcmH/NrfG